MMRDEAMSWFAVARSLFDHQVLAGPYDRRSAWLWLVAHAAYKDHPARTSAGLVELRRGEVLAGRDRLASIWGWTPKRVRTFLAELEAQGMVKKGQRTGQHANVLIICNYGRYQGLHDAAGPAEGPTEGQCRASEGPHITKDNKENKKHSVENGATNASGDVRAAFDAWNDTAGRCGLPRATKLTRDRERKIAARLAEYSLGGWMAALCNVEAARFLTGRTDHRFRADLDFLCKPDKFGKIHDGGYADAAPVSAAASTFMDADGVTHIRRYAG